MASILFLRLIVAVSMASLGALIAVTFKKISHLGLCILISFAAGALLSVALFDIFPETIELIGFVPGALSFIAGYGLFYLLGKFVSHVCPACAATHTEVDFRAVTITMVVALAIHSFVDGLAIYSSYLATSQVGIRVLLAVVYHKLPEGMALALVARSSGLSRPRAFFVAFSLEAVTTLAGGLIGFALLVPGAIPWIGFILGFAGGGFVYLVLHALLGEAIKHHPASTLSAAICGAASISLLGFLIGAF